MIVLADASLPFLDQLLPSSFSLLRYQDRSELKSKLKAAQVLLCRSTLCVDAELLEDSQLEVLGTASSGTNHLDFQALSQAKIQIYDAKGANASSVRDYVLACLALLETEGKLTGRKLGIIGYGAVGKSLKPALDYLGFDCHIFDPYLDFTDYKGLFTCNILSLHANLHCEAPYPSADLIDARFLSKLSPGTVIINAARGGIVSEQALLESLANIRYCTDVYLQEPDLNPAILQLAEICTPHIAGHNLEAKFQTSVLLTKKICQHYGLTANNLPASRSSENKIDLKSWTAQILSMYNPRTETTGLKQAKDPRQQFLALRAAEAKRHSFNLDLNS